MQELNDLLLRMQEVAGEAATEEEVRSVLRFRRG